MRASFHCSLFILVVLSITLVFVKESFSGVGKYNSETGRFDFIVSVRFFANANHIASIKARFAQASRVIYDATDRQHMFGKVTICNNFKAGNYADFHISVPGVSGKSIVKELGTFGQVGKNALIRWDRIEDDSTGHYTLAHEFAHLAYGVRDEYEGPGGKTDLQCVADPTDESILSACLMDDYYKRGGPEQLTGDQAPTLNEFCVTINHETDQPNFQQKYNDGKACWITISESEFFSAVPPPSDQMPIPGPDPDDDIDDILLKTVTTSSRPIRDYTAPEFTPVRIDSPATRIVLIIDRSGSMAPDTSKVGEVGENRLEAAKDGATLFINSMQNEIVDELKLNEFGVVSFATTARIDFKLQSVSTITKQAAGESIVKLTAGGGTAMGAGLQQALNLLPTELSCPEVFILLSDGEHNFGDHPFTLLDDLIARGIIVYTIGIGSEVEEEVLRALADSTGGSYFTTVDTGISEDVIPLAANGVALRIASDDTLTNQLRFKLQNIFTKLSAITQEAGFIANETGKIVSGKTDTISAQVDAQTKRATFILNWDRPTANLTEALISSDGRLITQQEAITDINITFKKNSTYNIFTINEPKAGLWKILINAISAAVPTNFQVSSLSDAVSTGLFFTSNKDKFIFPEPVLVTAQPFFDDIPVRGATVTSTVIRPNGSQTTINLLDNGTNGDKRKNDAIYSHSFSDYRGENGTFIFNITAEVNENGTFLPGESIDPGEDNGTPSPFIRKGGISVMVSNVPKENFVFGVDTNDGTFIKVDLNASKPKVTKLGYIVNDCDRIREITAMAWDPFFSAIFAATAPRDRDKPGQLFKIHPINIPAETGKVCIQADFIASTRTQYIEGLAVHPNTGELFGVDINHDELVRIDKSTGKITRFKNKIGFSEVEGLAFTNDSEIDLYATDSKTRKLIKINISTGKGAAVNPDNEIGFKEIESLLAEPGGNLLGFTSKDPNGFIKINRISGTGERFNVEGEIKHDIEGMVFLTPPIESRRSSLLSSTAAISKINLQETAAFDISQNIPNPFKAETNIQFKLEQATKVLIQILDNNENIISKIADGFYGPGSHSCSWDGKDNNRNLVPEGLYFCQMKVGNHIKMKKMNIIR